MESSKKNFLENENCNRIMQMFSNSMEIIITSPLTVDLDKCQDYAIHKQLFCTLSDDLIDDTDIYDVSVVGFVVGISINCSFGEALVEWRICLAPTRLGESLYRLYCASVPLNAVIIMNNGEPDHLRIKHNEKFKKQWNFELFNQLTEEYDILEKQGFNFRR